MISFEGKTVFITGANGSIARETVSLISALGGDLFLTDLDQNRLIETAQSARLLGRRVSCCAMDVTNPGETQRVVEKCVAELGSIDVMIANAGIFPRKKFIEMTNEEWVQVQRVNVEGVFNSFRAVIPHMRDGGCLLSLASIAAHRGSENHAHYAASKGALLSLMKSLAWELAPSLRVNCISPGPVNSPMANELMEHQGKGIIRSTALGRLAKPEEIAKTIAFMCSDWASFITGETINVNGGLYISG